MNSWSKAALMGGAVIGSACLGAGMAILFMPRAGPETRRQIRRSGRVVQAWLQDRLDQVTDLARGSQPACQVRAHAAGSVIAVER